VNWLESCFETIGFSLLLPLQLPAIQCPQHQGDANDYNCH